MLKNLHIKNFALIDELDISFGHSLNIITGETGAGKSIIVDALMAVLGERTSAEMIRAGESKSVVEGVFSIKGHPQIPSLLEENEYECVDDELILRREILVKGNSRCFINDSPAPLTLVKKIGISLVDFHGQHEHQAILNSETHIEMLDNLGGLENIVEEYQKTFSELKSVIAEYFTLLKREQELRQKQEYQRFQYNEICAVNPQTGEEQSLERELAIIENGEKLHDSTHYVYQTLYGDDSSVRDNLIKVRNILERLKAIDSHFEESAKETDAVIVSVEEIAKFAQNYNSHLEFYPERLEEIRERLVALQRLKKKFGSLEKAIEYKEELERELSLIDNFEAEIERLKGSITGLQSKVGTHAQRLTTKRKEISKKVEKNIENTLDTLGIPSSTFKVIIENTPCDEQLFESHEPLANIANKYFRAFENGIDKIHFHISTNKGEEPKPLERVVSGGEASRIMLSIKSILAKSDRLPMLVFDEIDTGISGRISQKVGIAMKDLADYHQIIAITHQPQIAALADTHIAVEKSESKNRVTVSAKVLDKKERVREVAKLLSGETITDATLKSARELIAVGEK
ncbi:MAG: DNA repair protein RecN [Candidatus Kapaibacterium sp.]|nr:DNA repair protein RecN [Bacteroidota bacterium]